MRGPTQTRAGEGLSHVGRPWAGARIVLPGVFLLAVSWAVAAQPAADIAWIQGTDWNRPAGSGTRHAPERLLDGRRDTSFCVTGGEAGAAAVRVEIGFTRPVRITHVRVLGTPGGAPPGHALPAKVRLTLARHAVPIPYRPDAVTWRLPAPLEADHVEVRLDPDPGRRGEDLVCVPDVILISEGRHLVVRSASPPLREARRSAPSARAATPGSSTSGDSASPGRDHAEEDERQGSAGSRPERGQPPKAPRRSLEGQWAAGARSSPERFMLFRPDGRFFWIHAPNDPAKVGRTLTGRFEAGPEVLVLRTAEAGEHRLRFERQETGAGPRITLYGGTGPAAGLNGAYHAQ